MEQSPDPRAEGDQPTLPELATSHEEQGLVLVDIAAQQVARLTDSKSEAVQKREDGPVLSRAGGPWVGPEARRPPRADV